MPLAVLFTKQDDETPLHPPNGERKRKIAALET
jgi:hypothetical protein